MPPQCRFLSVGRRRSARWLVLVAVAASMSARAQPQMPLELRVVGGLAGVNQYTRYEAPFWTRQLEQLSGGKYGAQIVPFDRAGIRGQGWWQRGCRTASCHRAAQIPQCQGLRQTGRSIHRRLQ